jgi:hypothetical protein
MKFAFGSLLMLALSVPSMALAETAPSVSLEPGWRVAAPTVQMSDNTTQIALRRYWGWGGRVYADPGYRSYYYSPSPYYYRSYPDYYYGRYWGPRYRVWY